MLAGIDVVEQGDVRAAVELLYDLPNEGSITQRIALYAESPRIDFETTVEWHTHHQLMKVAFPVDVRAADAVYQVQFGHLRRPDAPQHAVGRGPLRGLCARAGRPVASTDTAWR